MRSCDEALELISAALDGALTGEEQAALDEHLSHCPACSALFAELSGLHTAAAELEEVSAPVNFAEQVMAHIAADPVQEQPDNVVPFPKKKRSPWKGWAATAAVVAVVVLGAVTLPGQLGAGGKNAVSGATADCAAPAQAEAQVESADVNFPVENGAEEPFSSIPEDAAADSAANGISRMSAGGDEAESESASADQSVEADENADATEMSDMTVMATSQFSPTDSPAAYCGVLTLTGEPLPEGLENYEVTEDESGNLTYVVPADYFFSCLTALETEQPDSFTCDLDWEDAPYGLIIVAAPA